jgi:anti-sigma regulatory factor (Ser/Thr protein kinase)
MSGQSDDGTILLPTKLDALASLHVAEQMLAAVRDQSVTLTAPSGMTLEPFAALYLTNVARRMKKSGVTFRVNADTNSYAAHIGLLGQFDARFQTRDGKTGESDRYIAMREVTRSSINEMANDQRVSNVGETIEREAVKLAELLTQEAANDDLGFALTFCLREIMRNAYEHSESAEVLVCAQYRPSAGRVDLAFADQGVGVLKTVARNRRVSVTSESEAMKVALLPGISGARPIPGMEHDPWRNTGYGLFMTQSICRASGAFLMTSNDAFVRYAGTRRIERRSESSGVVIGLTLSLDALAGLKSKGLGEIHQRGRGIAKKLPGANVTASLASVTLRMVAPDV